MTSADDAAKNNAARDDAARDDAARAVMRAYADNLQPPPVAEIIARAEHTPDAPYPPSTARPRSRGPLVLAAASVTATIAVVTIALAAADRLPDRGATGTTAATPPTTSTEAGRMAPGCPPGLPLLEGPLNIEGMLAKPIAAKAGQQLTLPARIRASDPDRPLLSFQIWLLPSGVYEAAFETDMNQRAKAVAHSPVLRLTPDQQRVSPVLQLPTGLAPGTYDLVGYATWPSPSVCGVTNRPDETGVGSSWGVLGWVVVN
jgi:hypothetical protein